MGDEDAARLRRPRQDGPQHGDAAGAKRPRPRRVRPQRGRRCSRHGGGGSRGLLARRARRSPDHAARGLDHGTCRRAHRIHRDGPRPTARSRRRHHRRRQHEFPRRCTPGGGAGGAPDPLRRRRHEWWHLGPGRRLLPHARRRRCGVLPTRTDLRLAGAAAGLSTSRRGRCRPLREDDSQRHRVRAHAGVCRGIRADAR